MDMQTRQELRQQFTRKRQTIMPNEQHQAAIQLTQHVIEATIFQQSRHIAFYQAVRGEIDPLSILQIAAEQNKNCYLPILDPKENNQLCFMHYKPGDALNLNRYKILEPKFDPAKIIVPSDLDLVLVPLVAFDDKGNRLGSGAGYYDRTLAFLSQKQRPAKPYLLGLAYDWQRVDSLSAETWDISLDSVATEKGVLS